MALALVLVGLAPACLHASTPPQLTQSQKIAIIRALVAKFGIARQPLPPDKHGVEIAPDGQVLNQKKVAEELGKSSESVRRGERVAITDIEFQDDRIVFTINGGPHKTHWYDHIRFGMGGAMQPVSNKAQAGPHGSVIVLKFPHTLPALTPAQVQSDLGHLIDWDRPSKAKVMVQALPAPVKKAINAHEVLVGMTTQMVVAAKGRTGIKSGETDTQGRQVQDWVYGKPPETMFVRLYQGRVIRVTTYHNGVETVADTPDPALATAVAQQQRQATQEIQEARQPAPTLRRPGDAPPPTMKGPPPAPQAQPMPPPMQGPPTQGPPTQEGPPVVCCGLRQ